MIPSRSFSVMCDSSRGKDQCLDDSRNGTIVKVDQVDEQWLLKYKPGILYFAALLPAGRPEIAAQ